MNNAKAVTVSDDVRRLILLVDDDILMLGLISQFLTLQAMMCASPPRPRWRSACSAMAGANQAQINGRETGMAVGMLMARYKTDRETAFRALRDHARSQHRKVNDVAAELLSATESLNALAARCVGGAVGN